MKRLRALLADAIQRYLGPGPEAWDEQLRQLIRAFRRQFWIYCASAGGSALLASYLYRAQGAEWAGRACAFFLFALITRPRGEGR